MSENVDLMDIQRRPAATSKRVARLVLEVTIPVGVLPNGKPNFAKLMKPKNFLVESVEW